MSAAAPMVDSVGGDSVATRISRFAKRNGWVIGLWILLAALLVFTRIVQPNYGAAGISILVLAALPFAFAAAGQTVAIISGGIDLSIAAMITLLSVSAAMLMKGQSEEFGLVAVGAILLLGLGVGAINGLAIVLTRVPDIVVTLAFFFIWEGAALMVTANPDGSSAVWLRELIIGTVGADFIPTTLSAWMPKALVLLVVALGVVFIPLRRSRLGLSIYAIGSDRLAAFRSGVPVNRTRVVAYAIAGLFAAMAGLVITFNTGVGTPLQGPYLLASIAAVVLGGVSLAGGKGGFVGPIIAVIILRLVRQDLTFLSVDANLAGVIEGVIMVVVVLIGGVVAMRSRRS
ncbi:MAG: ABC transporter permease [Chloroflexota bacterium]